jgi:hypothetical protein
MADDLEIKCKAPTALIVGGTATIDSDYPTVLRRVSLRGGSAATSIEFFNGSATTGTLCYATNTVATQGMDVDLWDHPVPFTSKMFAKLEGTAGEAYVWYD